MSDEVQALLVGYHGKRNFGDDIFFLVAARFLVEALGATSILVAAPRGSVPAEVCGVTVTCIEPERYAFRRQRWLDIARAGSRCRYVLFAAGSIFTILPFYLFVATIASIRALSGGRARIAALGVSIGPHRSARDAALCRLAFGGFEVALVRDQASFDLATGQGYRTEVTQSYDLALAWEPFWIPAEEAAPPAAIGICLNDYEKLFSTTGQSADERQSAAVADAVVRFAGRHPGTRVRVFTTCSDVAYGDQAVAARVLAALGSAGVNVELVAYDGEPAPFYEALRGCRAVVASRMHAGIAALIGGVPLYQIAYARKISDFFEHGGLGSAVLVTPPAVSAEAVEGFLEDAFTGRLALAVAQDRERLASIRDRLRVQLDALATKLKGP